jgi:hypothetical protein
VVRQGYYRWLAQGPRERERTDAELTDVTCEIHAGWTGVLAWATNYQDAGVGDMRAPASLPCN